MYIYLIYANIIVVIACFLITGGFALFIMPLFLKIQIFFNEKDKKLYFKISLLNIKLFGGYAEISSNKIFVHLSKNKAYVLLPNISDFKKRYNVKKEFKLYSVYNVLEVGELNQKIFPFMFCFLENSIVKTVFLISGKTNPYLKLKNDVLIYEDQSVFKFNSEIVVFFNLLAVFMLFIKILSENLFNE